MIRVRYGKIHVGSQNDNSGLHFGNNFVGGRVQYGKSSEAVGSLGGRENVVSESRLVIADDDIVDGGRLGQAEVPRSES